MKLIVYLFYCFVVVHSLTTETIAHAGLSLEQAVVNGNDASTGEAPFIVQIRQIERRNFGFFFYTSSTFCGGSLIEPQTVVTAAHCVEKDITTTVKYGTHLLNSSPYPEVTVSEITRHPSYNSRTARNDIAVLTLSDPIQVSNNVQFITLQTDELKEGSNVQLFGWGQIRGYDSNQPVDLQTANMSTFSSNACFWYTGNRNVICARSRTQSGCQGDSGGPLVSPDGRLSGIVSLTVSGCPPGGRNIFTKVSSFVQFIRDNTRS